MTNDQTSDAQLMPDVPNGYDEIVSFFGDPHFDGNTVDPKWEEENMTLVQWPQWGIPRLYLHRKIIQPLQNAIVLARMTLPTYSIRRIGCFNPRFQRGSSSVVSVHTFGAAVDINSDQNPLIAPCAEDDPRRAETKYHDLPDEWIDAFRRQGFFWGGDFSSRFDPMHFQFCTGF